MFATTSRRSSPHSILVQLPQPQRPRRRDSSFTSSHRTLSRSSGALPQTPRLDSRDASEELLRGSLPPRDSIQEGTLPGAGGSHDCQDLAGPRLGCNVIQEHLGGGLSALLLGLGHHLRTPMRPAISNREVNAKSVSGMKQNLHWALP